MKVQNLLNMTTDEMISRGAITIVAFGDSVTHGCLGPGELSYETVYWNRLRKMLNGVRSHVPVNGINAGIGGTSATSSLPRLERDVISHHPDLVIVCFGLNDMGGPYEPFIASLREIFEKCKACGSEVILGELGVSESTVIGCRPLEDELTLVLGICNRLEHKHGGLTLG